MNAYHNYYYNNILGEGEEGKFLSKFRKNNYKIYNIINVNVIRWL